MLVWFFTDGLNPFYILGFSAGTIQHFSECFLFPKDTLKGSTKMKLLRYCCNLCPLNQFVFSALNKIQNLCCQQELIQSCSDQACYKSAPFHSYLKVLRQRSFRKKNLEGFPSSASIFFFFLIVIFFNPPFWTPSTELIQMINSLDKDNAFFYISMNMAKHALSSSELVCKQK